MILLQAAPAPSVPSSAPWWAALGVTLAIALIGAVTSVLVARAQRPKKVDPKTDPLTPIRKSLADHGATLAAHSKRLDDVETVLSESTDPDVRKRDAHRAEERLATIERHLAEVEREARRRDEARHAADAHMGASLARIEGYLQGQGERR